MITFGNVVACLANRHVITPFKIEPDSRVSAVSSINPYDAPSAPDVVRVGYVSNYNALSGQLKRGNFVLATDEPKETLEPAAGANIACIPDTDDIVGVIEQLETLLERVSKPAVRELLVGRLLEDNSVSTLVETLSEALGNPVVVVDSAYNIVAHSTGHDVKDPEWRASLQRGYLPFEFIGRLKGEAHGCFETDRSRDELVMPGAAGNRLLVRKLVFGGALVGYLIALEEFTRLESCGRDTYAFCSKVAAKQLSVEKNLTGHVSQRRTREEALLVDLIEGRVRNELVFRELVAGTVFRDAFDYRVVCLDMRFERLKEPEAQDALRSRIETVLPGCYVVFLEHWVVALLFAPRDDEQDRAGVSERISALVDEEGLRAGVSEEFDNLYDLKWHVEEGERAIRLAELMCNQDRVCHYERFRIAHLLSLVSPDRIERFVHPDVLRLAADDEVSGDELFETLDAYLKHGCSVTETARACYIHRNTVSYRIGQIEARYRLELSNPDLRCDYMVSCLIVNYLKAVRAPCPNPYRPGVRST